MVKLSMLLVLVLPYVAQGASNNDEKEAPLASDRAFQASDTTLHQSDDAHHYQWPFHKNTTDNACASHTNCFECSTSSSLCHWCAHDNACHAKGSVHGCFEGVDCAKNHTKPDPHPKSKNETKCASHKTCAECAISSSFCHWCAHDSACHAVGSYYGCVTGVDCYSNDRCRRKTPDPIDKIVFPEMGVLPIVIILFLGGICFCFSTCCYGIAGGVKGAYDDLATMASSHGHLNQGIGSAGPVVTVTQSRPAAATTVEEVHDEEEAAQDDAQAELAPLMMNGDHDTTTANTTVYRLMVDDNVAAGRRTRRAASRHMDRLFTACTVCYVIALMAVGAFVLGSIRYFPKVPQYNICNDSLAWKSLVDSMTSMKVDATIEILMSIMNPNHFDVALDMGKGSFSHDGAFVGSFEIPPAQIKAMSISDLTILAKFTPEKWEALSLTAEYYRGTLALDVDSQASIRVPVLANYTYEAKVTNMLVHVNDPNMMDRHLCACPQWKDERNKTLLF